MQEGTIIHDARIHVLSCAIGLMILCLQDLTYHYAAGVQVTPGMFGAPL
jgi:hypothetical protein